MKDEISLSKRFKMTVIYMRKIHRFNADDFKIKSTTMLGPMDVSNTLAGRGLVDFYQIILDTYIKCSRSGWDPQYHKNPWDSAISWLIREKDMDRLNALYSEYKGSPDTTTRNKVLAAANVINITRNNLCHSYGLSSGIEVRDMTDLTCAALALVFERLCAELKTEIDNSSTDFVRYYTMLLRRCAK